VNKRYFVFFTFHWVRHSNELIQNDITKYWQAIYDDSRRLNTCAFRSRETVHPPSTGSRDPPVCLATRTARSPPIPLSKATWGTSPKEWPLHPPSSACLLTYLLTKLSPSWETANCAGTEKLPSILWNPKVHHRVQMSPPLVPILNQIDLSFRLNIQEIRPWQSLLINFCNKLIFYDYELLAPRPTPSLRTTPSWLSATAYLIYSQLPSISGGCLLQPQPEDAPCHGYKGPT
jgi:hypothetical protein